MIIFMKTYTSLTQNLHWNLCTFSQNLALFEHSDEEDDTYTCSSDEESDDVTYSEVTEDNIKITNQKSKKPHIEEINNKDQEPGWSHYCL
jgi:hypothetical protein